MLGRIASPPLTFTKFAPARPDKAIKWAGAQIWQGPARADSLLVADCIDEDWAKVLVTGYNDATVLTAKVTAANQVVRDLLVAVSASALECKVSDPSTSEALTLLVASFRAQAKKAGLNPI